METLHHIRSLVSPHGLLVAYLLPAHVAVPSEPSQAPWLKSLGDGHYDSRLSTRHGSQAEGLKARCRLHLDNDKFGNLLIVSICFVLLQC